MQITVANGGGGRRGAIYPSGPAKIFIKKRTARVNRTDFMFLGHPITSSWISYWIIKDIVFFLKFCDFDLYSVREEANIELC